MAATPSPGWLGADVGQLDDLANRCGGAGEAAAQVVASLRTGLLAQPWAAGPFFQAFTSYVALQLMPTLAKIIEALGSYRTVLAARAEAQRRISAGERVDLTQLAQYESPLARGNAPGPVPSLDVAARHAENLPRVREALAQAEAELARLGSQPPRDPALEARWRLETGRIRERVDTYRHLLGSDDVQIIHFDPRGDGEVVAQVGTIDRDTTNVGILVPGAENDLTLVPDQLARARRLVDGDTAMMVWMGADFPDSAIFNAPSSRYARDAAPDLAQFSGEVSDFAEQVRDVVGEDVRIVGIGHSYGGVMLGSAAAIEGNEFDDIVHIGSAGLGVDPDGNGITRLDQYTDNVERVYSIEAPNDFIERWQGSWFSPHGADPEEVPGVIELDTGDYSDGRGPVGTHTDYLDPGTEPLRQLNRVLSDNPPNQGGAR